jgi:hypothetical protein
MATPNKNRAPDLHAPVGPSVPAAFAEFDVLEGFTPVDKSTLIGTPFGITGVRFRENERKVKFAELEIVMMDGEHRGFQDSSSTGVAAQIAEYLIDKGIGAPAGDWMDTKLFVPLGLRDSVYPVIDPNGKTKEAKTYYLTLVARERGANVAAPATPARTSGRGSTAEKD